MSKVGAIAAAVVLACGWCPATDLADAASRGDVAKVKELLRLGADPDGRWVAPHPRPGRRGKTRRVPLRWAASHGHHDVVLLLLAHGADVNAAGERGGTALHAAAYGGDPEMLNLLLDVGADIDPRDRRGATPLHSAARNRKLEAVELLLDRGADIGAKNEYGATPLRSARHWPEGAKLLLERGARYTLADVVAAGDERRVRELLDAGADPDGADERDDQPLALAARNGDLGLVRLLLAAGRTSMGRPAGGHRCTGRPAAARSRLPSC